MRDWKKLQRAFKYARRNPAKNILLSNLAAETGQSVFHVHRTLREVLGETPKHFTLRLRVDRAAAALISSQASILDIALECGFESHEVFCRALRRRYRMSPSVYRGRARMGADARAHAEWVNEIGPCVGLYHFDLTERGSGKTIEYTVSRKNSQRNRSWLSGVGCRVQKSQPPSQPSCPKSSFTRNSGASPSRGTRSLGTWKQAWAW
jgi:AraC-like DNA-binding protein